jgi:hypothetical protein
MALAGGGEENATGRDGAWSAASTMPKRRLIAMSMSNMRLRLVDPLRPVMVRIEVVYDWSKWKL